MLFFSFTKNNFFFHFDLSTDTSIFERNLMWEERIHLEDNTEVVLKHMNILKVDIEPDLLCILFIFLLDSNSPEVFETCNHIPA